MGGPLGALNDTKLILNDFKGVTHAHLGAICYHSESSDVPRSQTSFLVRTFFRFLQRTGSRLGGLYIQRKLKQIMLFNSFTNKKTTENKRTPILT